MFGEYVNMRNGLKAILTLLAVLGLTLSASATVQYTVSNLNLVPGGPSAYGISDFDLLLTQSNGNDPGATAQALLDGVLTNLNDLLLMPGLGWDLLATFEVFDGTKQIVGAGNLGGSVLPFLLTPAGDADGDGDVDGADLSAWQQNYSPLVTPDRGFWTGDWNGDGRVDGSDLAIWQQNYSPLGLDYALELPEEPTSNDVGSAPEPASMLLLVLSVALAGPKIRRAFKKG